MQLPDHSTVLFQGDSITDASRERTSPTDLGSGYPAIVAGCSYARHPDREVRFLNRGISGNRTVDLRGRWTRDCVELEPAVVTILIGINDCWRRYDSNDPTPVEVFEANYRELLRRTLEETGARLILMEPFLLEVREEQRQWREDLDPKRAVVRSLAAEFSTGFVPLDDLFRRLLERQPAEFWAADGVHPTLSGHAVIAQELLDLLATG